ncbi:hypothetical protein [Oryzobacter telluris]|uniref:hypothetical protein n=1 Tax=Oryzobacter telluris TaxID=3149179 RepID=UPI00370D74CD
MSADSDPTDAAAERRRQARENAEYHEAAAARAAQAEARRTAPMVSAFAEAMRAAGVEPTRLRARPYSGSGSLRTDVVGWYVRRDRRAAVGTDGHWYVLVVAPSLRGRLAGIHLDPSDAPLQVGAGGRDGDSVALDVLLRIRLEAGADFPS